MKHLIILVLILSAATVSAQEVYMSISGKSVSVASGDRKGQFDIWIRPAVARPDSNATISFDVYDAGLGGFSDLLYGELNTYTTYELHPFDALYSVNGTQLVPKTSASLPLQGITAGVEPRYKNRWVSFFQLPKTSEMGWIVRVYTDDGNDVNNFKPRLTGDDAKQWQIVALNLALGIVDTNPTNRIYFRPLFPNTAPPSLTLIGEEETTVEFIDGFGRKAPVTQPWSAYTDKVRDVSNIWGIVTSGSTQRSNNLVIQGKDQIIPFIFEPQLLTNDEIVMPDIRIAPSNACLAYGLTLSQTGVGLDLDRARWFLLNEVRTGKEITHTFPAYSAFGFDVIIPVVGRLYPQYVLFNSLVVVNQAPQVTLTGVKPFISPSERIVLDASTSFDPELRPLQFNWFVNGELRSTDPTYAFSSLVSGRFVVRLVVSDGAQNAGCTTTERTETIVVNTQPYAEIEAKSVIAKNVAETVSVVQDEDSDQNTLVFRWEGDGVSGTATGRTATVTHPTAGTYEIRLTADDQTGTRNAQFSTTVRYKVNAEPSPRFQLITPVAPGQAVPLNGATSSDADGDDITHTWRISDGRTFTGPIHEITFDRPGEYDISLTVDDGERVENSVQSITRRIRVNATPIPKIASARTVQEALVTFSAAESSGDEQVRLTYSWDFGDGAKGTGETTRHLYAKPGTYTVTLTVDDGMKLPNSVQRTSSELKVNANPVAVFTHPALVAPNQAIALDGSGSSDPDGAIRIYEWSVNGVPVGQGATYETRIAASGMHSIRLKVLDDSGFDEAYGISTSQIRVNHAPVVRWSADPGVTEASRPTRFTAVGSTDADNARLTYTWVFPDGARYTGETITHTFSTPGTYAFTILADDGEGLANSVTTENARIRVNQSPIVVAEPYIRSNSMQVNLDASGSYDPDGSALRFTWILPDGARRSEASFTWTAPRPGLHPISLILDDGEGLASSRVSQAIQVMVNRAPIAVVDTLIQACSGNIIIFSSASSYDPDGDLFTTTWDFGDGNTSTDTNPVHMYTQPGLYSVTLTLNDGFSPTPTVAVIPVRIEGSPKAIIPFETITVCANTPVVFDGSQSTDPNGQVGSYSWDFGDASTGLGQKVTHFYQEPGVYDVILTVVGSGSGSCSNMSQVSAKVIVVEGPQARFSLPTIVAPQEAVVLDASASTYEGAIQSVTWDVYQGETKVQTLTGLQNRFMPERPGTYRIVLTLRTESGTSCNTSTTESIVKVNAAPSIAWNAPEVVAQFAPFMLSAVGSTDSDGFVQELVWRLDGAVIGTGLSVPLPTSQAGSRVLSLTIRDNAGVGNSSVTKEAVIVVNSSPVAQFSVPEIVYQGEMVSLSAVNGTDADGDVLSTSWFVNGELNEQAEFKATDGRYTITLVQNDGRDLANSESRVSKQLVVTRPQPVALQLPTLMVTTHSLSASDVRLPAPYVLMKGGVEVPIWSPGSVTSTTLEYGWKPRGDILATFSTAVRVVEPLRFTETQIRLERAWNPANPFIEVNAPAVNRDAAQPVSLTWMQNGRVVAAGPAVQLRLVNGENRFELVATDQNVTGSTPARIPVVIVTKTE